MHPAPAPQERRPIPPHAVEVAAKREWLPGLDRLSLALDHDRVDFPVLDHFGRRTEGSLADQYTVRLCHRLQPLRGVHDIAESHPFPRFRAGGEYDQRLARVDAD